MTILSSATRSRACLTICATVLLFLAVESPARAQSAALPSSARRAYRRAIQKVEALTGIQAALADRADAQEALLEQATSVRISIEGSSRAVKRATESIDKMPGCLATLSRSIEEGTRTAETYLRTARESLSKASEFSRASNADAAPRLAAAEAAFERRFESKQALLGRADDVLLAKQWCSRQLSEADAAVGDTASSFGLVSESVRALVSKSALLERLTRDIVALALSARSREWLHAEISNMASPPNSPLNLLRGRVGELDGIAYPRLSDPHPDAATELRDYHDAVLRLVVEQDAQRFLALLAESATADCTADECLSLLERVDDQEFQARETRQAADQQLVEVERNIREASGVGVFSRAPSAWLEAQLAIEEAFELANIHVAALVAAASQVSTTLEIPVANALEAAIAERRAAYARVFGTPERDDGMPSVTLEPVPAPAPGIEPPSMPRPEEPVGLAPPKRHAFEVLALRSQESADYGAYTYVIFPRREARPEYQALLEAIVALTPAADPEAPMEVRKATNLFEIPGRSAAPIDRDAAAAYARRIENYDNARALSLVQTASDGVLTAPKVIRQFQRSPGPFLLTVPVPLEQAKGVTQLLLADLNGYPVAGFQDLVKSYQNELIAAFPTTQKLWRPPWNQQLALGLLNIGVLVPAQNFVALR